MDNKDLKTANIAELWSLLFDSNTTMGLSSSSSVTSEIKPIDLNLLSADQLIVVAKISENLVNLEKNSRKEKLQILGLQQFLSEELNKNEILENKLKEKESELVTVAAARDKYHKLIESSKVSSLSLNFKKSDAANDKLIRYQEDPQLIITSDPHSMIGKFVRKSFGLAYFFGLIVGFSSPYFMVVYEDADEEELNRAGVLKYIWMDAVPSIKEERCRKHANNRALKLRAEEQDAVGVKIPTHNLLSGITLPTIQNASQEKRKTDNENLISKNALGSISLNINDRASSAMDISGVKRKNNYEN